MLNLTMPKVNCHITSAVPFAVPERQAWAIVKPQSLLSSSCRRRIPSFEIANCLARLAVFATGSDCTQMMGVLYLLVRLDFPSAIGTLKSILRNVSAHHRMTVPEVLERLDL